MWQGNRRFFFIGEIHEREKMNKYTGKYVHVFDFLYIYICI